jgi:autotransporter translocation and assembly factor TamB
MHRFKRLITAAFLTVFSIILLFSLSLAYLIVTPLGGKILVRCFKQEFLSMGLLHIGHYEGSLHEGFILKDVRITGLSYFPDALLRIQEVRVHLPLWDLPHSDFGIFNARLIIPDSDPIVFTGEVYAGQIKGNLYAKSVDLHSACRFWALEDIRKNLQGFISDTDVTIQGPLSSPRASGQFMADSIRYRSILLTDGLSRLDLTLIPAMDQFQVKGIIIVNSGLVNVRKINLGLSQSRILFQGDFFDPVIDIHLGARVEDMDFHLTIKGTSLNPQLTVTSDPPMPPQDALRVLFTGNAWSSSTSPFNGVTSSQLAENFLDYSLQDMNENQQLGFKTKLTDNLKLGAEMDQQPLPPGATNTFYTRKINGEMDMTEHMSLNVSQEVFSQDSYPSYQDAQPEDETQVYLQYKKRF